MSLKFFVPLVGLSVLFAAELASAIEFNEVARLDVSFAFAANIGEQDPPNLDNNPKYVGTNPLGVAWNGSKLYLAGHDNFGSSLLPVGLIEILNPASLSGEVVIGDADLSDAFGQIFQPVGRGYSGIALQAGRLAASYDNGSATATGIQVFDTADNSLEWDLSASGATGRGGSGVTFDPGFSGGDPAAGAGVAWTTFGSGRRALNDTATGATIWQLDDTVPETLGMQWLTDESPAGNFARDLTFDPETGDVYARRSNDVDAADRTGDNATDNRRTLIDNGSNGDFALGQKIEFLNNTSDGDLLIYNDSPNSSTGQAFVDVVKVVDTEGIAQEATFNLLGGLTGADIANGPGIYDFSYDEASGTLALLDFFNRNLFIFEVGDQGTGLAADFNVDGTVDLLDLDILGTNFGGAGTATTGDANSDGTVDLLDLDILGSQFGQSAANAASVPEPTGCALAAMAMGLVARRRRQ